MTSTPGLCDCDAKATPHQVHCEDCAAPMDECVCDTSEQPQEETPEEAGARVCTEQLPPGAITTQAHTSQDRARHVALRSARHATMQRFEEAVRTLPPAGTPSLC